jgi:putative PIN family toxin of toxin-antitoxin system
MNEPERVVFDCNVYFQAIISQRGPAYRLLHCVTEGHLALYASEYVLAELQELTTDARIAKKYRLEKALLEEFFAAIRQVALIIEDVPQVFDFTRDPDDAHYVDLAIAAQAKLIVSRDRDLLSLNDDTTLEGRDFKRRFPDLEILTPTELLRALREE